MARFFILMLVLAACGGGTDRRGGQAPEQDLSFHSVSDLNDAHFELKKDGSFEYYRLLFDSIKNSRLSGTWQKEGDTFLLTFREPEGSEVLGSKAVISEGKNEIKFFGKVSVDPAGR